jgi:Zn-dependent peptidase ImmA (M78 family)
MDENTAISRARQLLARYDIKMPAVDALRIAEGEGYVVRESEKMGDDEAGQTFNSAGQCYIVVNKNNHPYRRRFTIFHEIAHHALGLPSVHGSHIPSDELERFRSRPPEEVLCDVFAAACLVPWHLIQPLTEDRDFSASTVMELSDLFEASKLCVASRFASASGVPVAYVVAEDGIIRYCVSSRASRETGIFLRTGVQLPSGSAAARAMRRGSAIEVADMEASDWSHSDAADRFSVHEEAIYQPAWGQSLSLLTFEEDLPPFRTSIARDEDDNELLPELTGELSWRKR